MKKNYNPLDMENLCFMGTNIVSGSAKAVVISTSTDTYFGSLANKVIGKRVETSFDKGVNKVSWLLITFMLIIAIGIYIPFSPLGAAVGLQALPLNYFPWLVGILLGYAFLTQFLKKLYIKKFHSWL